MNDICEAIEDFDDINNLGQGFTLVDHLEKVRYWRRFIPRPTFVNTILSADYKANLIKLLKEYVDYFACEYSEMPGLNRDLDEHRLSIKAGFKPYKQPARQHIKYDQMKEEINHLLNTRFIRSCHYARSISNIVPIEKKDLGKIRVFIDFIDLNKATPKDEYPMAIADMLINEASGHRVISSLMVMWVTIKYLWPMKIRLKWLLDVMALLVCLSGLS